MSSISLKRIIQLTKVFLEQIYHRSPDSVLGSLHPSVLWMGTSRPQSFCGYEQVSTYLTELSRLPPCDILNQRYEILCQNGETCVVTGLYTTLPKAAESKERPLLHHITLVWILSGAIPQILHLHASTPVFLRAAPDVSQEQILYFHGLHSETYFFHPYDILYLEASNSYCYIYCRGRSACVCHPISDLVHVLPGYFIRTHRSYLVNKYHVSKLERYQLTLEDGTVLPIPEKKYQSIKTLLSVSSV